MSTFKAFQKTAAVLVPVLAVLTGVASAFEGRPGGT